MAAAGQPLDGRHAFITGAGSGIGAAIALALAAQGARVSLGGRRAEPLKAVASKLGDLAGAMVELDVADAASVEAGVARLRAVAGGVDILVNNAGQVSSAPFAKTSLDLWTRMLSVNLTGVYLVTQALLPGMTERGAGRVINIASTAGLTGYPYVTAYVAAKHGVVGLTRALALELARTGVTVNAVCPGYTDTPLVEGAIETIVRRTGRSAGDARRELVKVNPQGRLVTPAEVADCVVWLASPGASAVTGQAIVVAGGEVLAG